MLSFAPTNYSSQNMELQFPVECGSYFIEYDYEDYSIKMSHYVETDFDNCVYSVHYSPYCLLTRAQVEEVVRIAYECAENDNFMNQESEFDYVEGV